MLVSFPALGQKCLRKSTYKEEGLTLSHGFTDFSPWSVGSIIFGPVMNTMEHHGRGAWYSNTIHLMVAREKGTGSHCPLQGHVPSNLLPLGPTSTTSQWHRILVTKCLTHGPLRVHLRTKPSQSSKYKGPEVGKERYRRETHREQAKRMWICDYQVELWRLDEVLLQFFGRKKFKHTKVETMV